MTSKWAFLADPGNDDTKRTRTGVDGRAGQSFSKIYPYLVVLHLRIVNLHERTLDEEVADKGDGGRLAGIACVGFEGKS